MTSDEPRNEVDAHQRTHDDANRQAHMDAADAAAKVANDEATRTAEESRKGPQDGGREKGWQETAGEADPLLASEA